MTARRTFLKNLALLGATSACATLPATPDRARRPRVLFFDVNETLLDLAAMTSSVGAALGGRDELAPLWFTTMLQYSLVTTVAGQYFDFGAIGGAALRMVAANHGIALDEAQAKNVVRGVLKLPAHREVADELARLRSAGFTLVSFTNSSAAAVTAQFTHADLLDAFDVRLSVDAVKKFKPHADAYAWAARKMNVAPADCMLVAAHGWDIAGAAWAGWRTAFIARPGAQLFPLAPAPELDAPTLTPIADRLVALAS